MKFLFLIALCVSVSAHAAFDPCDTRPQVSTPKVHHPHHARKPPIGQHKRHRAHRSHVPIRPIAKPDCPPPRPPTPAGIVRIGDFSYGTPDVPDYYYPPMPFPPLAGSPLPPDILQEQLPDWPPSLIPPYGIPPGYPIGPPPITSPPGLPPNDSPPEAPPIDMPPSPPPTDIPEPSIWLLIAIAMLAWTLALRKRKA